MSAPFVLLVPVKGWERAKTRLQAPPPLTSRDLAPAFALDAVEAAVACPAVGWVYVVTGQPGFAPAGARVLPDEGGGDLNAALRAATVRVRAHHPGAPVAAMCADLPCLLPADLLAALTAAGDAERWFVADADGTGTTLLAARADVDLDPAFGPASADRHAAGGAVAIEGGLVTLRRDVDTAADLDDAIRIGLGRHSASALSTRPRPGSTR